MAFDINSAVPVTNNNFDITSSTSTIKPEKTGFDLSSAKPVIQFPDTRTGRVGILPTKEPSYLSGIAKGAWEETKRIPSIVTNLATMPVTLPFQVGQSIGGAINQGVDVLTGKKTLTQSWQERKQAEAQGIKSLVEPYLNPIEYMKREGVINEFLNLLPVAEGAVGVARGVSRLGGKITLKSLESSYGVPKEAIAERLARPKEIQNALPPEDMASNKLPEIAGKLNEKISELSNISKRSLSEKKDIDTNNILSSVRAVKKEVGTPVTSADIKINNELNGIEKNIVSGYMDKLSELELKDIITKIDNSIDWGRDGAGRYNMALQSLRVKFDNYLKGRNPVYSSLMKPESELIELNKQLHKQFGLVKVVGEPLPVAGNNATIKVLNASKQKNLLTKDIVNRIDKSIGENLSQQLKDTAIKYQFDIARPAGSKRVNLGAIVGSGIGGTVGGVFGGTRGTAEGAVIGGTTGALIGAGMDKGGLALGKMIDWYADFRKKPVPTTIRGIQKPSEIINPAIQYGTQKLTQSMANKLSEEKGEVINPFGKKESIPLEQEALKSPINYNGVNWDKVNSFLKRKGYDLRGGNDTMAIYRRITNNFTKEPTSDHLDALMYGLEKKTQSIETKAKRHFGLTNNLESAGYFTQDGKMLDLSGNKFGATGSTRRQLDHREVNSIMPDELSMQSDGGNSKGMREFMNRGNIRVQDNGIDLVQKPTSEQLNIIKDHILKNRGESYFIDISDKNGNIVNSFKYEYPNVKVSNVLNDLENYFKKDEISKISNIFNKKPSKSYMDKYK